VVRVCLLCTKLADFLPLEGTKFLFTSKLFFVLHAFYGGPPCFIHSFMHSRALCI
jgi:hypothetical protein